MIAFIAMSQLALIPKPPSINLTSLSNDTTVVISTAYIHNFVTDEVMVQLEWLVLVP